METSQEKQQEALESAKNKVEIGKVGDKDQKVIKAYDQAIEKLMSVFNGRDIKPTSKIVDTEVEEALQELIKEDKAILIEEFKGNTRQLMKDRIKLDSIIEQKTREFNKAIVDEKRTFTEKVNKALKPILGLEKLRTDYIKTLTANGPGETTDNNVDDTVDN